MYGFALSWLLLRTGLNASDAWMDRPLKTLTLQERRVLIDKATELPFSGVYDQFDQSGLYTCKLCGAPLYRSKDKFASGCGWPAFDVAIEGHQTYPRQEPHGDCLRPMQWADIGMQYRSVLFYGSKQECSITDQLIALFRQKGINVATQLQSTKPFYRAENYHQEYYERKGTLPYCHGYVKRF